MKNIIFVTGLLFIFIDANDLYEEKTEVDPKDNFFRYFRIHNSQQKLKPYEFYEFEDIPIPGGLLNNGDELLSTEKIKRDNDKLKYKRIKRKDSSELISDENNKPTINNKENDEATIKHNLKINDFIRFKRKSEDNTKNVTYKYDLLSEDKTKVIMKRDFSNFGMDREPRGATKEQWIKQPYPVSRQLQENEDDNLPSASNDNTRAPRVHFVTQRRPNSGGDDHQKQNGVGVTHTLQPIPSSLLYERERERDRDREGRAKDFDPYSRRTQIYYHPPRNFDPYRPRYYDPYFDRFEDRRYAFEEYNGRPMMLPPPPPPPLPPPLSPLPPPLFPAPTPPANNKQRRIIYYATLPEIVRNPSTNREQRYNYWVGGSTVYDENIRKPGYHVNTYQLQKQRDRDFDRVNQNRTSLYPVKVSTDVNVHDSNNKNPERKIYSQGNKRFQGKSPSFQTSHHANF